MKLFPLCISRGLLAVAVLLLAPLPGTRAQSPQSAPNLTPKRPHAAKPDASDDADAPDLTQPVATVNGTTVYRPLMHSAVSNPVDRALLIFAYRKSGLHMSSGDRDLAAQQLELSQFNGSDKRLDARLKTLNATRDDYKQFAVEETKIRDVLRSISRGSRSPRQAEQQRTEYLAQLRKNAAINTTRQ